MRPIVLASTSPYRSSLLGQLGIKFVTQDPGVNENPIKALVRDPRKLVRSLAKVKAEALGQRFPEALIIGGDQVAELDGEILSKPGSVPAACRQLGRLAGRTHRLWTGVAVHEPRTGRTLSAVERHCLTVRKLSRKQIRAYVEGVQPVDCAGSYKIEGMGMALFEDIRGRDPSAIVGLPLLRLVGLLLKFGVPLPLPAGTC
jgi:septum formation protein